MKNASFYLFNLGFTLMVGGLVSCGGPNQIQGTYKVTGTPGAIANITYAPNGVDSNSQAISQTLPWQTTFTGTETEGSYQGSYVFLSALNDASNTNCNSSITISISEASSSFQQPNYEFCGGQAVTLFGYF